MNSPTHTQPNASSNPTMATKACCTTGWHDSLLNLLRKERRSIGSDVDFIVVDNAKPHRKHSDSQSTATMTQTSSLDGSLEDFRSILDGLLEDSGDEDSLALGSVDHFHRSYPAPKPPQRRRRGSSSSSNNNNKKSSSRTHENMYQWGSSSDPEIGYLTLDDMLREEFGQSNHACPCPSPRRPVRQVSLESAAIEACLSESGHSQSDTSTLNEN